MNRIQRNRRHRKIRSQMHGTAVRPRVCVFRSSRGMEVQVIDDDKGITLVSSKKISDGKRNKVLLAQDIGAELAKDAQAKGITSVVFDRGGYAYHGRVKALADALRSGGLSF